MRGFGVPQAHAGAEEVKDDTPDGEHRHREDDAEEAEEAADGDHGEQHDDRVDAHGVALDARGEEVPLERLDHEVEEQHPHRVEGRLEQREELVLAAGRDVALDDDPSSVGTVVGRSGVGHAHIVGGRAVPAQTAPSIL